MSVLWREFVIRAVIDYFFVLDVLRFTGKQQMGQLAPSDPVLLLILADIVQNAMNAGDNPLVGGLISACRLYRLTISLGCWRSKARRLKRLSKDGPNIDT